MLEDNASEQDEWVQTVCATFASLVLALPDFGAVDFDATFS